MALMTEPPTHPKWPPGHGYKYSVADQDNWVDLALKDGWRDPWGLIEFNFGFDGSDRQLHARYVNWCLRNYVGCVSETDDKKNYQFSDRDFPGIVYTKHDLANGEVTDYLPFWVPGRVPTIGQTGAWDCWWTVAAIMCTWRRGRTYTAREVVAEADESRHRPAHIRYLDLYDQDKGLPLKEFRGFARSCGMFPIDGTFTSLGNWYTEMWRYRSPLAIVHKVVGSAYHGRVLHGITGDGGPSSRMHFSDPGVGGLRTTEPYDIFQGSYASDYLAAKYPIVMRWGHL